MINSVFSLFYLWNDLKKKKKKLIKTNIDNQQTIYDDKILFLKSQATALRKTNQAKHIYLKFASMDDHRTIRTKMSMCEEPKKYVSLSAWQDNRNNQTDFKHNNQLWPQDGTSWSEMLYCTEHCWSEKSSEIALCFLTTPRWMQMNIKWLQPYTKKAGRIDPNINSINLERGFVKEKKRLFEGNESRRAV